MTYILEDSLIYPTIYLVFLAKFLFSFGFSIYALKDFDQFKTPKSPKKKKNTQVPLPCPHQKIKKFPILGRKYILVLHTGNLGKLLGTSGVP